MLNGHCISTPNASEKWFAVSLRQMKLRNNTKHRTCHPNSYSTSGGPKRRPLIPAKSCVLLPGRTTAPWGAVLAAPAHHTPISTSAWPPYCPALTHHHCSLIMHEHVMTILSRCLHASCILTSFLIPSRCFSIFMCASFSAASPLSYYFCEFSI